MTEGNSNQPAGDHAQKWADPLPGLARISEAAKRDGNQRFTSLMHHVTPELLKSSYFALKRSAAVGIDEMTWRDYQEDLDRRLLDLHERVQSARYRALPSKRIYIAKDDGRQRPIGIAALEDKIVQKAVTCILEQIYEADFTGFSYGFRPGRSQHNALDAVSVGITRKHINWILDLDLESFFDTLNHEWLETFLEHRIGDQRMLRLIKKWLRAGVSEEGHWSPTSVGTPQGAVISPLLANIFLHYAVDLWAQQWRQKEARGDVIIVRYADDIVMGFKFGNEADRFLVALKSRLEKF
jgi:RNA-directed DNA polymerase